MTIEYFYVVENRILTSLVETLFFWVATKTVIMNGQNNYSHFGSFISNSETINNDLGLQIPIVNVSPIVYENHQISNRV